MRSAPLMGFGGYQASHLAPCQLRDRDADETKTARSRATSKRHPEGRARLGEPRRMAAITAAERHPPRRAERRAPQDDGAVAVTASAQSSYGFKRLRTAPACAWR